MTKILIAADKFKGTLTATEVAEHITKGLRAHSKDLDIASVPVADGGDGTLDAAVAAGFRRVRVTATGPAGQDVQAAIAIRDDTAVVELAAASGLVLLGDDLDPLRATSRGTGDLIRAALDEGCHEIVLGIGGSACTDGGAGLLQALGAQLKDQHGNDLDNGGGALRELADVDLDGLDPRLRDTKIVLASDVDNPLLGPKGAAAVYAPQKGADDDEVEILETGLERLAELVDPDAAKQPGAGAAGGVGYAALAVLHAQRRPGVDVVFELIGFADALPGTDLVITGEGSLDEQTLHGKAPAGVAAAAKNAGIETVAVCGQRKVDDDALKSAGIAHAYALTDIEPDVQRCQDDPGPLLEELARRIAAEQLQTDA